MNFKGDYIRIVNRDSGSSQRKRRAAGNWRMPEIIGTCNLTHKDTVYVGDSNVDMQTGKNAQVTTIGVSWGFRSCAELQAYHPDCIADKPCDILNFLGITD